MILFIPMLSVAKIIFDNMELLKPYGYLIGNRSKESPSLQIKNWFKKNLAKKNKFKTIFLDKNKEGGRCCVPCFLFIAVFKNQ